jgi:sulfur-oxidizing protein SoxA
MRGVAARYPTVAEGQIVTLEQRILRKRPGLAYESDDLLALTAFVARQSRGLPWQPRIDDRDVERGRKAYLLRRGQMNLACTHCHDSNAGKRLGSETISQGQANGYPAYRLEWGRLGSLQRRLRACLFGVRAELPPFGSRELLELELFLAQRGRGLAMESPAVRR